MKFIKLIAVNAYFKKVISNLFFLQVLDLYSFFLLMSGYYSHIHD